MAVTEPGDLADVSYDGKSPTTDITNALASQKGFPMELADGGVVKIVKKVAGVGGRTIFVDADGVDYIHSGEYFGPLILADGVTDEPDQEPAEAPAADGSQVEGTYAPETVETGQEEGQEEAQ